MGLFSKRKPSLTPEEVLTLKEVSTVATLNGLRFYSGLTAQIFQNIYSQVGKIDLKTVEGQTQAFIKCAPVSAIIGRIASYSMNGRYSFENADGKPVTRTAQTGLPYLLKRPNFFQTWAEFIAAAVTFVKLNGQCYILPIAPAGFSGKNARNMFVIPNWLVTPQYTGKSFLQDGIDGVISGYHISNLGVTVPASDMIIVRDTMPSVQLWENNKLFEGQSRLYSLGDQVNNLIAIQDALYTMTTKRGAMGAWVPENVKDSTGVMMPIDPKEKNEVIESFSRFGVTSEHTAPFNVLRFGMKWVQAAMNVTDLKLFEGNDAGVVQVAMAYDFPTQLLGMKDSTFTNLYEAGKHAYSVCTIPTVENVCNNLVQFFMPDSGLTLKAYFDHLDIFQKSKKDEADAMAAMVGALTGMYEKKVITMEEYRAMIQSFIPTGVPFDAVKPAGSTYYQ